MTTPTAIGAPPGDAEDWEAINWQKVTRDVRRLQMRIAKATREGKWGKVKSLQWLLTHSRAARLLAVRHVTTSKGRNTPGVDGVAWRTPEDKIQAVASLKRHGYRPLPLRRHCIPKKNGKMRALGIPTMKDRAMQALYSYALLPVAETTADHHSYGFRPLRACRDAIQQCYILFARKGAAEWVLDADIKACFDRISHQWMKDNIPMDRKMLTLWLESGYLDNGNWFETTAGTPQGGVISPLLANLTLDGLQRLVQAACPARSKVNFVRYADDFIVTAATRELLEKRVLPALRNFLDDRGLHLSEEKTRLVHITDGFDFLGQTIRKFKDKLLIQPAKGNIKSFLDKIRDCIRGHHGHSAHALISDLIPRIRGWATYHRHICARNVFEYVDWNIGQALRRWCRRQHPEKSRAWVERRYFHTPTGESVFSIRSKVLGKWCYSRLLRALDVKRRRYIKMRAEAHPFDPAYAGYVAMRRARGNVYELGQQLSDRLAAGPKPSRKAGTLPSELVLLGA